MSSVHAYHVSSSIAGLVQCSTSYPSPALVVAPPNHRTLPGRWIENYRKGREITPAPGVVSGPFP